MNIKKILLITSLALLPFKTSNADEIKKPIYAYGESLTETQKQNTARILNVDENSKEIQVNINEMNALLRDSYDYYQVYSSVYIKPSQESGVKAKILTPETITVKTEAQYTNAAITAGASNVDIYIASVKPVDGSGALAGLYKAYQDQGVELNKKNIEAAQQELETISNISQENISKDGFSDEDLNEAIADIKAKVIEVKKENGDNYLSNNQIRDIVINVSNQYNINEYLTDENIEQIVKIAAKTQRLNLTDEQVKALTNFGKNLFEKGNELVEDAQQNWDNMSEQEKEETTNKIKSFFNKILEFFSNLISKFTN